ncbi:MAG: hypothetical protein HC916_07215 [Coleofasciculaceae cyanobacterium SM2_1_6]|nr:hypothetical protein [Coleofasciculaceae cyanobacterium SM2_1_6]
MVDGSDGAFACRNAPYKIGDSCWILRNADHVTRQLHLSHRYQSVIDRPQLILNLN